MHTAYTLWIMILFPVMKVHKLRLITKSVWILILVTSLCVTWNKFKKKCCGIYHHVLLTCQWWLVWLWNETLSRNKPNYLLISISDAISLSLFLFLGGSHWIQTLSFVSSVLQGFPDTRNLKEFTAAGWLFFSHRVIMFKQQQTSHFRFVIVGVWVKYMSTQKEINVCTVMQPTPTAQEKQSIRMGGGL